MKSVEAMREFLVDSLAGVLEIDRQVIAVSASFRDLGLNSTDAILWSAAINRKCGSSLSPTHLFEHPTIEDLAAYLHTPNSSSRTEGEQHQPAIPTLSGHTEAVPIAVIGIAGQFPRAANIGEFWKNLSAGVDCTTDIPDEYWSTDEFFDADASVPGKSYSKRIGALDGKYHFDHAFFGISPAEAQWMDPRQRIVLQTSWNCLEDAGIDPHALAGARCAVFVGCRHGDYGQSFEGDFLNAHAYLGESSSILAARISYFLNLKGPAVAIDTACSSSLVAIATACDSLLLHNCDLALAGGVCLINSPAMHVMASKAGMLSRQGFSAPFDASSDGIVPAEGVGVVLLKRLEDAIADGDSIHAVIRAWGTNQDGRTNGITAPSVSAQAQLEEETYRRFGINPESISFVEAHGTGTRLGDPIEVQALTSSFRAFTQKTDFCFLGSVKANVGHLLAAAGMAGFIKAALALRYRTLPPTIHHQHVNPQIPLATTPFVINTQTVTWPATTAPLRGAVSSFGFSGTNAHAVLEEYRDATRIERQSTADAATSAIIVLSAKTKRALVARASALAVAIDEHALIDRQLRELAYTLQVGRTPMRQRLALAVTSIAELRLKLTQFVEGNLSIPELYVGEIEATRATDETRGDASARALDVWLTNDALDTWSRRQGRTAFLQLWIDGLPFNWQRLYAAGRPEKLHLPGYPFEPNEHRLPTNVPRQPAHNHSLARSESAIDVGARARGREIVFTIDGTECFSRDHVLYGERIMPAAAFLALVYQAVRQIGERENPGMTGFVELRRVVFLRRLVIARLPLEVIVRLSGTSMEDAVSFEVVCADAQDAHTADSAAVYCEGDATFGRQSVPRAAQDLLQLRARCSSEYSGTACYAALRKAGAEYGEGHQAIQRLLGGRDASGDEFAIGELQLPTPLQVTLGQYALHPSIVDGALQSSLPLRFDLTELSGQLPAVAVAYSIDSLRVLGPCPADAVVVVRRAPAVLDRGVHCFDIEVSSRDGQPFLSIDGYTSLELSSETAERAASMLFATWMWRDASPRRDCPPSDMHHVVVVAPDTNDMRACVPELINGISARVQATQVVFVRDEPLWASVAVVAEALRNLVAQHPAGSGSSLIQVVVLDADKRQQAQCWSLSALLRGAQRELAGLRTQLVGFSGEVSIDAVVREVHESANDDSAVVYSNGPHRRVRDLREIPVDAGASLTGIWKPGGVYLLVGGAGGIGRILLEDAAAAGVRTIIVFGRHSPGSQLQELFESLRQKHLQVDYQIVDVTQRDRVERAVSELIARYGALHGVVHLAAVTNDGLLRSKTASDLANVLAPKLAGIVNLDAAVGDADIDFFIAFSSACAIEPNIGQTDYALANAFLDEFARQRTTLVQAGERRGRSLVVNWPYWSDGGIRANGDTLAQLQLRGTRPLPTSDALRALSAAYASDHPQVLVLYGDAEALRSNFLRSVPAKATPMRGAPTSGPDAAISLVVRRAAASVLKVAVEDVEADSEFSEIGFDSISLTQLANALNGTYQLRLTPAVFFEHRTVATFTAHLERLGVSSNLPTVAATDSNVLQSPRSRVVATTLSEREPRPQAAPVSSSPGARSTPASDLRGSGLQPEPIAIVGVSCVFPGAKGLEEFWQNLREGRDSVQEIPPERWDWRRWYGDPHAQANRTNIKWGAFIDSVDEFDPLFFGISPREAELMDPQQRLLLMHAWNVIEEAGYAPSALAGTSTGVFVGTGGSAYSNGYNTLTLGSNTAEGVHGATSIVPSVGTSRVSFFLDLHGPSEPIETACSSSLVAVHRAVQSIQSGDCQIAIVGGVNTIVTPHTHVNYAKAGMLSEDGRCKTFSAQANGYVRGEGVGMLLLKRLSAAQRDGDHIYGLIRGSSENHGGRANSLTAPNPQAQAQLLRTAYERAGVDVSTVTYIEAHGTGTSLGDPIEMEALKSAFAQLGGQGEGWCGVGSVKSNIGHLELAAGVAGMIKVLLQMKHATLVPSLHCAELNPYLQLEGSPFYVVREPQRWEALKDSGGRALPRRAGVSSFGFGGVNAHVVLEEYVEESAPQAGAPGSVLVVLSGKNEQRLRERVSQLLEAVRAGRYEERELADIAYTLQVGREAMESRLGLVVSSLEALGERLGAVLEHWDEPLEQVYRGEVKRNKEAMSVFALDEDMQEALRSWVHKGKYGRLLDAWVKGAVVPWALLHEGQSRRRLSLPTYPFAKDRYWVSTQSTPPGEGVGSAQLHPLLHANTSDLSEQRYSTQFSGEEFFLRDHVVRGERVLPAVAYLEMARAALERCTQAPGEPLSAGWELSDVVWMQPLVVSEARAVHIGLQGEGDRIRYEIYSYAADSTQRVVHAQGAARAARELSEQRVEVQALQAGCTQQVSAAQCYEALERGGLKYGAGQRALQELGLGVGAHGERYVLARLELPQCVRGGASEYVLHPSVLDGALQAGIGFELSAQEPTLWLPYELRQLEVFGSEAWERGYVYVRRAGEDAVQGLRTLDLEVLDESGRVRVRLQGLSCRAVRAPATELSRTVQLLERGWEEQALVAGAEVSQRWVFVDSIYKEWAQRLQERWPQLQVQVFSSPEGMAERLEQQALQVLQTVQQILQSRPAESVLVQVVSAREAGPWSGALWGLLSSAQQENPKFLGQWLELGQELSEEQWLQSVEHEARSGQSQQIRYVQGRREVVQYRALAERSSQALPWKDGGVYLISGGAGGLGRLLAREIGARVRDARVILVGRSVLSDQQSVLEPLRASGVEVEYRQVDVSDAAQVASLVEGICAQYGGLDGVIHAAGVLRDSFLIKKSAAQLREVLAPKVRGLVNLDEASRDLRLDFFVMFSSLAGVYGNVGQADYAVANAFMDRYAQYRQEQVQAGARQGRTLSVAWPLWSSGGMSVDEPTRERLRRRGLSALSSEQGWQALYEAYASAHNHVVVVSGQAREQPQVESTASESSKRAEAQAAGAVDEIALQSVERILIEAIVDLLKVPAQEVDVEAELSEFGFDSVSLTALSNLLNRSYELRLTPTIFFEHSSVRRFAQYLVKEHARAVLGEKVALRTASAGAAIAAPAKALRRWSRPGLSEYATRTASEPIAIVGVSGVFPQASGLEEFWQNLREGRDSVQEIPPERWDWRRWYGDPHAQANRTNIKWGAFIDSVDEFDPLFFGISPREAELMDPQQRLLLMYGWKALEDAGYAAQSFSGSAMGIFVGTSSSSGYSELIKSAQVAIEGYSSTGVVPSVGPNRLSYLLNVHGPSEPIETACSSSLVAVHRAVQSIQSGDCELALAGGVNTVLTPTGHISFGKAGMLSEDGRCKTFSAQANGYVRGEGVGMLLLKRLSAAQRDGDHIYGLIRGSSENHGGRANSLTAPNPQAQAQLLRTAYERAGVDVSTVTYIEAHGTGTSLGDPIEMEALKSAFAQLGGQGEGWCGVGSVKSNIGHLELAAGVAGMIKVLLQMKHATLVPSLHCAELNPYLQLEGSPFYVVREPQRWEALKDSGGRALPRRAGVSSFGFGGVNAHVVLEEYVEESAPQAGAPGSVLVVLSGKNEQRLRERVSQLLEAVRAGRYEERELADIAYTLQVGREAMESRLGLVVSSLEALGERLGAVLEHWDEPLEQVYRGEVKRNKEAMSVFALDEDMQEALRSWVHKGKYGRLLDAWVKGAVVPWALLHEGQSRRRLSLPTYPFAKDRYWVSTQSTPPGEGVGSAQLHPLLHANTSDLSEQRYSTQFSGEEFFLRDHVVRGERVLPAVAYLEMARAAAQLARGKRRAAQPIWLKDVVFAQPLVVREPLTVHICLQPHEQHSVKFQIYTEVNEERRVHCQGTAFEGSSQNVAPTIDMRELQSLKDKPDRVLSAEQCYAAFQRAGLEYGPSYRALEQIQIADRNGQRVAVATLRVSEQLDDQDSQFELPPSLLDGALQTLLGTVTATDTQGGRDESMTALPFALDCLENYARPTAPALVVATREHTDGVSAGQIDVIDAEGKLCVRIRGLLTRAASRSGASGPEIEPLLMVPESRALTWEPSDESPQYAAHLIFVIAEDQSGTSADLSECLSQHLPNARSVTLYTNSSRVDEQLNSFACELLQAVQTLIVQSSSGRLLAQLVVTVTDSDHRDLLLSLSGLLKSASAEHPRLVVQTIAIAPQHTAEQVALQLRETSYAIENLEINHEQRQLSSVRLAPLPLPTASSPVPIWKDNGIYLITGGAGGIGLLLTKEIGKHAPASTIVLVGRSELNCVRPRIESLGQCGPRIVYKQADVADRTAVKILIDQICSEFGGLNGVVHAAGILRDSLLTNKTVEDFSAVFAPKVAGTIHLDEATAHLHLDFFVMFSSLSGIFGNIGQADYATANAFMDRFAHVRARLVERGNRQGRTLVMNWPLWSDGGMGVSAPVLETLRRRRIYPLTTRSAFMALYRAYATNQTQVAVLARDVGTLSESTRAETSSQLAANEQEVISVLVELISRTLKIATADIDTDAEWNEFGLDSISLVGFANAVARHYQLDARPAALLQHSTIRRYARYLSEQLRAHSPDPRANSSQGAGDNTAEVPDGSVASPVTLRFLARDPVGDTGASYASNPGLGKSVVPFAPQLGQPRPAPTENIAAFAGTVNAAAAICSLYPQAYPIGLDSSASIELIERNLMNLPSLDHIFVVADSFDTVGNDVDERVPVIANLIRALERMGYAEVEFSVTAICASDHTAEIKTQTLRLYQQLQRAASNNVKWCVRCFNCDSISMETLQVVLRLEGHASEEAVSYRNGEWFRFSLTDHTRDQTLPELDRSRT